MIRITEYEIMASEIFDETISKTRILKLSPNEDNNEGNDDVNIFHIVNCKNIDEVRTTIQHLNFEKAPNVFAFVAEVKDKNFNEIEKLLQEIDGKFLEKRSLVLQISCKNVLEFYVKRKSENFVKLNLNLAKSSLIELINDSKLSVETFFNILKHQNCSLIDADLSNIAEFLNLSEFYHELFNFAINQGDETCIRLLNLFDVNLTHENQSKVLKSTIYSVDFDIFLAYLGIFKTEEVTVEQIRKILSFKFEHSKNAFLNAIELRNVQVVRLLLTFSKKFDNFFNFNLWKSVWYSSINLEHFDICEELIKADFNFNQIEKNCRDQLVLEYQETLDKISKLHDDIKDGNFEEVKIFTETQKFKMCYGSQQFCALEQTIECKRFEIYSYLRAKGFYTDKSEQMWDKIELLSNDEKRQIRDENLKYKISDPDAFFGILLSKCFFDSCSTLHFEEIRQMLVDLAKIKEIRPVLQIVALSDVKIIFDFETESVKTMDPTRDEHTLGIAYFNQGLLYVGKNANKNQRYGTFAHELTHFVYFLVYENSCLPYCEDDEETKKKWIKVVDELKAIYSRNPNTTDNIIKWVFMCYESGYQQNAETAVRVNDLLASYYDNPEKCIEIRRTYACIFDFYDIYTLPDLNPEIYRLIKLNDVSGVTTKIKESLVELKPLLGVLIKSNIPELSLSQLYNDFKRYSKGLKFIAENIFINLSSFLAPSKEFEDLLKSKLVKRIVIDASLLAERISEVSAKLKPGIEYFVVISSDYEIKTLPNFRLISEEFTWNDLNDDSKRKIRRTKVNFQNTSIKLLKLLPDDKISSEIIFQVCKEKKFTINCHDAGNIDKIYIYRKFQPKNESSEFTIEQLIESVENQKIVVIADIAGSGKTFILNKIKNELIKKFPYSWIFMASLRDFSSQLLTADLTDFPSFITNNVLKLKSPLDVAIFNYCFTQGKVSILFDAFDEISPECKENAIKLFKLHGNSQIWITTREYLEHNLTNSLQVDSFKLMPYSIEDQIGFASKYWSQNTPFDSNLINRCASLLVARLALLLTRNISDFFGLPLMLRILVEIYKEKLSNNFEKVLDENFKLTQILDELVGNKIGLWIKQVDGAQLQGKSTTLRSIYRFLALKLFINKSDIFGIDFNFDEWNLEDIVKAGIIRIDSDKVIRFIHEAFAEHFVSDFLSSRMKTINFEWKYLDDFIEFLVQILTEKRFKIVRFLLNESIHEVKTSLESFKSFKLKFDKYLEENQKLSEVVSRCKEESTYNLALFFTTSISSLDLSEIFSSFNSDLSKMSSTEVEFFFSHIFKLSNDILLKFLLTKYSTGNLNFLKRLLLDFNHQFRDKLKEKKFTTDEISKIFMYQNKYGENVLNLIMTSSNREDLEKLFESLQVHLSVLDIEKMILSTTVVGMSILHVALIKDEQIFSCAYEFMIKILGDSKMKVYVKEFDMNRIKILKIISNNSTLETLNSFHEKVKLLLTKDERDKHLTLMDAVDFDQKLSELVEFTIYSVAQKVFVELRKLVGNKSLIENLENKELIELLKSKGCWGRNLLVLVASYNSSKNSNQFLWSMFEKIFERKEVLQFLTEIDNFGNNFLHNAARFSKSEEVFELTIMKLVEIYDEEMYEILMSRGQYDRNSLHHSVTNENENSFFKLFEVYSKYVKLEDFVIELDQYFKNLLHYLVRHGSVSMLNFTIEKLKQKLSSGELRNYFSITIKSKKNILHLLAFSEKADVVKYLLNFIETEFGQDFLKNMLNEYERWNRLPIHCVVLQKNIEYFNIFFEMYQKCFSKDEIKTIFETKEKEFNKNILELASDQEEMYEALKQKL